MKVTRRRSEKEIEWRRRPYFWLIHAIGVLVPRRLRRDWRQEWEAELRYRERLLEEWERLGWRGKLDLSRRSLGAFRDALVLQPQRLEDEMFQDLRYGLRMLVKSPAHTFVAWLSLAIGIGATSAIFSVVNGVVLRPLPYPEPEQLVRLWHNKAVAGVSRMPVSAGNIAAWRQQAQSFSEVTAYSQTSAVITGDGEPEQVSGSRVSHNLLPMLGYEPLLGRGFVAEENLSGQHRVIILSYRLWQRRFGGDASVLNQGLTLDHTDPYTVIGVMPQEADFPDESEFWTPETTTATARHDMRRLSVLARLKLGVTLEQAQHEVALIHGNLQKEIPDDYAAWEVEMQPLQESEVGRVREALLILFGAVGFVLLIACANVANLLLARATTRQKEMAMRAALGASRFRLLRQLLTESILLALLGGAGGMLFAYVAVQGLIALNPPDLPRLTQVSLDGRVLAFAVLITLLVGLLFGLAPALHASKPDLNHTLKEGGSSIGGRRWFRRFGMRDVMVIAQTALAIVLLAGSGLLIKSFVRLRQVELGFTPTNVVTLRVSPPFNRFSKEQKPMDFYRHMIEALRTVAGVESVAVTTSPPTTGAFMNSSIQIAGRPVSAESDGQRAFVSVVSPDYFRLIDNPLRAGRFFTDEDNESSPRVTIINETMARRYFPGVDPVGQRIAYSGEPDRWLEVVGVTADVKQFGLESENQPSLYQPYRQRDARFLTLIVRTSVEPSVLIPALRGRIQEADRFTAITQVRTLDEAVSKSVAQPQFYALLLGLFAGIALTLAALGIYGVMAYSVSQRTHEIGIRMALGAEAGRILHLVLGRGLRVILAGVVIGLFGAVALTRLMTGLLFEVSATDPAVFAAIAILLIAVALIACLVPARQATRIDPLVALRRD